MAEVIERLEGVPLNSVAGSVSAVGGTEREFIVAGEAQVIALASGTEYPTHGRWPTQRREQKAPFKTRIIVERPADPAKFNGTVIVVWNNNTLGEMFEFPDRAAQLVKDGFALVGASVQQVGIDGYDAVIDRKTLPEWVAVNVPANPPCLKNLNPGRYESLRHPGDDYSCDMFAQVGAVLAPNRKGAIDPLGGLSVRHVIAAGGSQSAIKLGGYINGVHKAAPVYDAYLLYVYPSTPGALTRDSAPPIPQMGGINPSRTLLMHRHYLRDDLGVPVIVLNSEYEAGASYPNFQEDTDLVRWWDVAGAGHAGAAEPAQLQGVLRTGMQMSSVSFAPLYRAAVFALHHWLTEGEAPPHQPRIDRVGDRFARDADGNATGGIRMPDMAAPLGMHVGENHRTDMVQHFGSSTPFPPEKIRALYPTKGAYLSRYQRALDILVEAKLVLPDDAAKLLAVADSFTPPDG